MSLRATAGLLTPNGMGRCGCTARSWQPRVPRWRRGRRGWWLLRMRQRMPRVRRRRGTWPGWTRRWGSCVPATSMLLPTAWSPSLSGGGARGEPMASSGDFYWPPTGDFSERRHAPKPTGPSQLETLAPHRRPLAPPTLGSAPMAQRAVWRLYPRWEPSALAAAHAAMFGAPPARSVPTAIDRGRYRRGAAGGVGLVGPDTRILPGQPYLSYDFRLPPPEAIFPGARKGVVE